MRRRRMRRRGGGRASILHRSCRLHTRGIVRPPILTLRGGHMFAGGYAIVKDKNDIPGLRDNPWGEGGRGRIGKEVDVQDVAVEADGE